MIRRGTGEFGPQTYAFMERYGDAVNEMIGLHVSVRENEQVRSVPIVSGFGVHAEKGTISYQLQDPISRAAQFWGLPNPPVSAT
ncbi:hypothetical protein [Cupriavidus sp. AcVe19-1a]|uniref:hypothetical protein n=1 Tax=Cupriavidus sp. AcVe19-1a TaxID=2821359 RepID=UPI001AE27C86|nr:hypothetical protein [Cupriavidus sp. AcVe19-1a]MBP0633187.1 hypothetical protein [Cupriavidus sp. AcVe19-1a]